VKKEGFVLPIVMIFLLFVMLVAVFLYANSNEVFKASKELDIEVFENFEKLSYVSVLNTWQHYLSEEERWEDHHITNYPSDTATITIIEFPDGFFNINLNNSDKPYQFTVFSSSAYYEENEFTLEMSSTSLVDNDDNIPKDSLTEDNLMVTFQQTGE